MKKPTQSLPALGPGDSSVLTQTNPSPSPSSFSSDTPLPLHWKSPGCSPLHASPFHSVQQAPGPHLWVCLFACLKEFNHTLQLLLLALHCREDALPTLQPLSEVPPLPSTAPISGLATFSPMFPSLKLFWFLPIQAQNGSSLFCMYYLCVCPYT